MPHRHRFYHPHPLEAGIEAALDEAEAHHAARVARVRIGDTVTLFDGQGGFADAEVIACTRREVSVRMRGAGRDSERVAPLAIALAWLHRDKAIEFVVRHGTELGVDRFLFFCAERSEGQPKHDAKWERIAIEVCKQCGRNRLPEFVVATDSESIASGEESCVLVLDLEREAAPIATQNLRSATTIVVGPEGDFTDDERALLYAHGATPVSLGAKVFRSEAAAVYATAIAQYIRGGLGPVE